MDGQGAVESDKSLPKQGNDLPSKEFEKKQAGGIYQCQDCGSDYTAKTTWQKFCPECGAKRKKGVLLARKIKGNGMV